MAGRFKNRPTTPFRKAPQGVPPEPAFSPKMAPGGMTADSNHERSSPAPSPEADPTSRKGPGSRCRAFNAALWAISLLIIYVLSPLPMQIILDLMPLRAAVGAHRTLEVAYAPLIWLSDHNEPVHDFYAWYESLLDV